MDIDVFGQTDIGNKREKNEDSYLCLSFPNNHKPKYLLAVADGMGGHRGGEIASSIAIDTLRTTILSFFNGGNQPEADFPNYLESSVQEANRKVFDQANQDSDLTGMGSTLVAALLSGKKTIVSNVGDSRAYLIRDKTIHQITSDHNWKNEQLQKGDLSEEDIKNSPYRDLITRSLGLYSDAKVDIYEIESLVGDYFLLCSDGLHSLLDEKDILKIFRKIKDVKKICHKLIETALKRGGHDNVTVVAAHLQKEAGKKYLVSDTVKLNFDKV